MGLDDIYDSVLIRSFLNVIAEIRARMDRFYGAHCISLVEFLDVSLLNALSPITDSGQGEDDLK